jgi:hypothetical protein
MVNKMPRITGITVSLRKLLIHAAAVSSLTALTQIGAIAYLIAYLLYRRPNQRLVGFTIFLTTYAALVAASNMIAPTFGRVPISCFTSADAVLAVRSPLYCVLNRNFVTPKMFAATQTLASHMNNKFTGTKTLVLDANFPFIDGFPLLPHLSHSDGKKLDIAFYYAAGETYLPGKTRSPIGYFAFEQPDNGSTLPCEERSDILTFRWNLIFLQNLFPDDQLDAARMSEALRWLSTDGAAYGVEKIFIEPHLAEQLGVKNDRIRFQGCRAARHDDHIHFQIR